METESKSDNSQTELISLYDKLRAEILQNDVLSVQLLGVSVLLISAAMGFAFKTPSVIFKLSIFLAVISLLFISMLQTIERMRGTFMIASYMRVFIEPFTKHLKWEIRLKKYREKRPGYGHKRFNTFLMIYVVMATANLILIVFYTSRYFKSLLSDNKQIVLTFFNTEIKILSAYFAVALMIVGIVTWVTMFAIALARHHKYVENNVKTFQSDWESIFNDESPNSLEESETGGQVLIK